MDLANWGSLPDHILVSVLSYLPLHEACQAARTCKAWNDAFCSPYLWREFTFVFEEKVQEKKLKCIKLYGTSLKSVKILLDQSDADNRSNACKAITQLANQAERRLQKLHIRFTGENPLFYAGQEFVEALATLFGPVQNGCRLVHSLQEIDLSGLPVAYDDKVFNLLSENNPELVKLNIQNKILICKVTPNCILRLVQRCRKLKELCLFSCSFTEDVLLSLCEGDRTPMEHLSISFRREEKYKKEIDGEVWKAVVKKLPNLEVTLRFDHTCPFAKIAPNMMQEIPVSILRLETFTYIYDEVNLAASYYKDTLRKLVLQTRPSAELNRALLNLATQCKKLNSLHVFCVLEKETIDKIFDLHPSMKENNTHTLKYTADPHPWIAGRDC